MRPYFLSVLATVEDWSPLFRNDVTLRSFLIDEFVLREARLISRTLGISVDVSKEKLYTIFEEVAGGMADDETDFVDISFLQLVAEYVFADVVDKDALKKIVHRSGSFALLEKHDRSDLRAFPHTEISNFFLARLLIRTVCEKRFPRFLRRGIFSRDLLVIFQELFESIPIDMAQLFNSRIRAALDSEESFDHFADNGNALLVGTLTRELTGQDRNIIGATISTAMIHGSPIKCKFVDCSISRLYVDGADLKDMIFENCTIGTLYIDKTTKFGVSFPQVHSVQMIGGVGARLYYKPSEINDFIKSLRHRAGNADDAQQKNEDAVNLLERVCRAMLRQFFIKVDPNDQTGSLLTRSYWQPIKSILSEEGRIKIDSQRQSSGTNAEFVHIIGAIDFLTSSDDEVVQRIWRRVAALP